MLLLLMQAALAATSSAFPLQAASPPAVVTSAPPDPATLQMPDMTPTSDQHVIADGQRFFYFYKPGVTYEQAYRDISDCYRFMPVQNATPFLPMFVPWRQRPGSGSFQPTNPYGLVGELLVSLGAGQRDRRDRQARMRLCLEPQGYVRYPLAEASWRQLTDGYSPRSIALQARAASGPDPHLPRVTR